MNVDTGDLTELVRQVGILTARVSALTGRVSSCSRNSLQAKAEIAILGERIEAATTAEQIIRRAGWPELPAPPPRRPARARHLSAVPPAGGQR